MTKYCPEQTKPHPKRNEDSSVRVARYLRRRYPNKTAEIVSAETGVPATTVKSWLRGAAKPSFDALITLAMVYEADFMAAVMPKACGWLDDAAIRARTARLMAEQAKIERELAELQS